MMTPAALKTPCLTLTNCDKLCTKHARKQALLTNCAQNTQANTPVDDSAMKHTVIFTVHRHTETDIHAHIDRLIEDVWCTFYSLPRLIG